MDISFHVDPALDEIDSRFEIIRVLGSGAVGTVYHVKDRRAHGKECALKVLYPHLCTNETTVARFKREVLLCRFLPHPGITQIYEFRQTSKELVYFSMEYVPGVTLGEYLAQRPEGPLLSELVYICWQILSALAVAHEKGIVHRDVKPQNILITEDLTIKVTDFGLACLVEDARGLTKTGASLGTPYYMSPEQFRGERADAKSDIYAFGVMLFELLTGTPPFSAPVFFSLALQHLTDPIPDMLSLRPGIPPWLVEIVGRCTQKTAEKRTLSAAELALRFAENIGEQHAQLVGEQLQRQNHARRRESIRMFRNAFRGVCVFILSALIFCAGMSRADSNSYQLFGASLLKAELQFGRSLAYLKPVIGLRVGLEDSDRLSEFIFNSQDRNTFSDAIVLVRSGVWRNSPEAERINLFLSACRFGHIELFKFLQQGIPWQKVVDDKGMGCIHYAALRNSGSFLRTILRSGDDARLQDVNGDTALHFLSIVGPAREFRYIKNEFKNDSLRSALQIRNNEGLTPLQIALRQKTSTEYLELLLQNGADPYDSFPDGSSQLEYVKQHYDDKTQRLFQATKPE